MKQNYELLWYDYVIAFIITLAAIVVIIILWTGVTDLMRTIESALVAI